MLDSLNIYILIIKYIINEDLQFLQYAVKNI